MFQIQNVHLLSQKLARKRTNPPPQVNVVNDTFIESKQTEVIFDLPFYTLPALFHYLLGKRGEGGTYMYVKDECNLLSFLSLDNYTPPVINCSCKNKGINKSHLHTFPDTARFKFF
jgi:hypothetical protein